MDGKIIVNAEMLNPAHVPDKMPYRERELDLVSSNATQGVNTFIHGPPGSGKTALAKTVCIQSSSTSRRVLRSEEHTSELQSPVHLVCRLLLEKKNKQFRSEMLVAGKNEDKLTF